MKILGNPKIYFFCFCQKKIRVNVKMSQNLFFRLGKNEPKLNLKKFLKSINIIFEKKNNPYFQDVNKKKENKKYDSRSGGLGFSCPLFCSFALEKKKRFVQKLF